MALKPDCWRTNTSLLLLPGPEPDVATAAGAPTQPGVQSVLLSVTLPVALQALWLFANSLGTAEMDAGSEERSRARCVQLCVTTSIAIVASVVRQCCHICCDPSELDVLVCSLLQPCHALLIKSLCCKSASRPPCGLASPWQYPQPILDTACIGHSLYWTRPAADSAWNGNSL